MGGPRVKHSCESKIPTHHVDICGQCSWHPSQGEGGAATPVVKKAAAATELERPCWRADLFKVQKMR